MRRCLVVVAVIRSVTGRHVGVIFGHSSDLRQDLALQWEQLERCLQRRCLVMVAVVRSVTGRNI
jgi:hypothetical protein